MNAQDPHAAVPGSPEESLAALKKLLLEDELRRLADVERQLQCPDPFQEKVESVLPDALTSRNSRDGALQQALEGPIETSIQQSVRNDPHKLANALFPIMGPAIRQSIRDTVTKMVEGFNQTLDQSLSPQSIRWRIEAKMTGKSFAEVVMAKTLVYCVEQAFLIHNKTGLLLTHAVNPDIQSKDADMVSGMFTAISDFVQDSFAVSDESHLETMQVGDLNVLVRQGPSALLAVAVRGTPASDLKTTLDQTLESIHSHFSEPLRYFEGDVAPFHDTSPLLEDCLITKQGSIQSDSNPKAAYHWWALATTLALLILFSSWQYLRHQNWNRMISKLNETSGLSVHQAKLGWWHKSIRGLRDPIAIDPENIIAEFYSDGEVQSSWKAYQSLEDQILQQRLTQITHAPENIRITVESGKLSVSGDATLEWLEHCKEIAQTQAGITKIDIDLFPLRYQRLKKQIESVEVYFDMGESDLTPEGTARLQRAAKYIISLSELLKPKSPESNLILVTGLTDSTGNARINAELSQARAEAVIAYLQQQGIPPALIKNQRESSSMTASESHGRRCVYFTVNDQR